MKNLSIALLSGCLVLVGVAVSAQAALPKALPLNEPDYNKPKLFADLPDQFDFNPGNFSNVFAMHVGQAVALPLSPGFVFSGQVISTSDDAHAATVVIRSTNRDGARLVLTRVTGINDSVKYLGRIISFMHGDSYEIVSENDRYYFKKKGIYDLMSE